MIQSPFSNPLPIWLHNESPLRTTTGLLKVKKYLRGLVKYLVAGYPPFPK
jgi:hypothetical protein